MKRNRRWRFSLSQWHPWPLRGCWMGNLSLLPGSVSETGLRLADMNAGFRAAPSRRLVDRPLRSPFETIDTTH